MARDVASPQSGRHHRVERESVAVGVGFPVCAVLLFFWSARQFRCAMHLRLHSAKIKVTKLLFLFWRWMLVDCRTICNVIYSWLCVVCSEAYKIFFILVSWCTYVVIDKLIKSHERMAQNAPLRVCRKWCDLRCVNCLRLTYMKIYFHKFNSDTFCSVRDVASWLGWW